MQDVSRGILNGEMHVTSEKAPASEEYMTANLAGQMAQFDGVLKQPA